MLGFDADTARILDESYEGSDFRLRRLTTLSALAPRAGESIADVGCGSGLLALELSRAVGRDGSVIAIDPSAEMRAAAERRCGARANVRIVNGAIGALPLPDESIDAAVALQVFEYLDRAAMAAALADFARALRPGGRLVIGDIHWDTLAWHSDDPARMARFVSIWDRHVAEPATPALLPPLLREAGFVVDRVVPLGCTDIDLRADGLAAMLLHLVPHYAIANGLTDRDEAQAWADEQRRLAGAGRFFFHVTHFNLVARRA